MTAHLQCRPFLLGHSIPLDGLRGLAVIIVMAGHLGIKEIRGGGMGVDAFFVLSGFLITALLLREQQETGAISLRKFYIRRSLRLVPALTAVILAVSIYTLFWAPTEKRSDNWQG